MTAPGDVGLDDILGAELGAALSLRLARVPQHKDFREVASALGATRDPATSVSYALPWVAVLAAGDGSVVGVDIEPLDRVVDPRIARFVRAPGESEPDLLTLWTIKEAAYKVDSSSRDLTEYRVTAGACRTPSGNTLRTTTLTHQGLRISVAINQQPKEAR